LTKALREQKLFVNQKHDFEKNESILLQLLKGGEIWKIQKRVPALMLYSQMKEDVEGLSVSLHSRKWKYVIECHDMKKLQGDSFNLENELDDYEENYNPQLQVVKLRANDEAKLREKLAKYL
jgi:hypothetical protein